MSGAAPPADGVPSAPEAGVRQGTARAAFAHRPFRRFWLGVLFSNMGTWMQNVALAAFAYRLTGSAAFVGLLQLSMQVSKLVLGPVSGMVADAVDRRRLMVAMQTVMMGCSVALALVVRQPQPSRTALFAIGFTIGLADCLYGPAYMAFLPHLVRRADLPGAVSLQSLQLNLSRIVGPAVGGLLLPRLHESGVFLVNAATYLAVIGTLLLAPRPPRAERRADHKATTGFAVARRDPLVRLVLVAVATLSIITLPFLNLMPAIATVELGLDTRRLPYGLLYAAFGAGGAVGAVLIGSLFVGADLIRLAQRSLVAMAACLLAFAAVRSPAPAYPVVFLLGLTYMTSLTAMSTRLQTHLSDEVRGRVMSLWMMAWGGAIPIGAFLAGWLADRTSPAVILVVAGVWSLVVSAGLLVVWVRPHAAARAAIPVETVVSGQRSGA